MARTRYLTAQESAELLQVSLVTLYAYVSRGLIRSEAVGDDRRSRRYYAEDVYRLLDRKDQRRNPEKLAESALHFGAPVMESAITLIADGKLYYRGEDALRLAQTQTVEAVASLLWTGRLDTALMSMGSAPPLWEDERLAAYRQQLYDLPSLEQFQALLPLAAAGDYAAYDLRPGGVMQTGARILFLLAAIASNGPLHPGGIADTLTQAWAADQPDAAGLIRAALILCADHELNVSAFTVRCVASAGATPYAAVIAGLSALSGSRHGGHTERVEMLFDELASPEKVRTGIASRLKRGDSLPGFGHRLYPQGDPRGRLLLDLVSKHYEFSEDVALAIRICEEALSLIGDYPTLDFGLVTLAKALRLRKGAALALFALGRTIGWIGHAIEQYETDRIIRPRARYTGKLPQIDS